MRIIDRYLLRQFVQVFLICFLSLAGLFVVLDAFSNLDEFFKYADSTGDLVGIMGEYYAFRTLMFFEQLGGVLALIAAMFTVTWIQRHNELTVLMAAGISKLRVVTPVIVAAAVISLINAAGRECVIPHFRRSSAASLAISKATRRRSSSPAKTTARTSCWAVRKPSATSSASKTPTSCCRPSWTNGVRK